jgi:hypothetical protein
MVAPRQATSQHANSRHRLSSLNLGLTACNPSALTSFHHETQGVITKWPAERPVSALNH